MGGRRFRWRGGERAATVAPVSGRGDGGGWSRRGVLAGAPAALLAGCARARGERSLTWWAMGTTGENAPVLLPPFERSTGLRVEVQAIPWTGAHEKLLTGFAGDSLPDVVAMSSGWLPELALLGAVAPAPMGTALFRDQFPGALASVMFGGRPVGVPWSADSWVHFYRRDLLSEVGYDAPPLDWPEWARMAAAIRRRHPDRHAVLHLLDWPEPLFAFAAQQPEPLLRDRNGRGNFSSAGFRSALAFYKRIYDEGWSPVATGAEAGDTYLSFRSGWFAILPSNAVSIGDLRRRTAMFPDGSWGVARVPGPTGPGAALVRGQTLAVSAHAREPQAAWKLVDYLCGTPMQQRMYGVSGDLPTRPSAWDSPALAGNPVTRVFAEQIADSVAPPPVPEWERILSEVQLVAEHMVRGEFGVDAAAAEMDRRIDRILEKRRWMLDRGHIA